MPFAVEISGLLAVFILLMGAWGVLAPSRITDFVTRFSSKGGLWFAAGIRLVLGLALWFAAPVSRAPLLLQVLGMIALVAAFVLPFMGVDRFKALINWWTRLSPTAMRLNCLFAVAFGGVVLWALLPAAT
ncbi:MAG: hypothetical protein JRE73_09450 [Deltaproteobacteria bacterium]|nr:hypothetical protein [Deltaproteobacteria bacterium]